MANREEEETSLSAFSSNISNANFRVNKIGNDIMHFRHTYTFLSYIKCYVFEL
jgi:hypothetical protein